MHAGVGRTWDTLLELADWWPPCWPAGQRLVFEPRIGGRLGTTTGSGLDPGGRTLWGVVTGLDPGRELRLDGTMDIRGPVIGQWRIRLEAAGASTAVSVEHRVLGSVDAQTRAVFARRWPATLARLAERARS